MEIAFCNSNDKVYQALLNDLLKDIFLDFKFWYDLDLWDENYESYSIMEDGMIVSNICLYKTKILFREKTYSALSVGAVATREGYRGRGYSRHLMAHINEKYKRTPMYLSANEGVIDFYPMFGFQRVYEKLPTLKCKIDNKRTPMKLSYDDSKVWDFIHNRVNYSGELDCLNGEKINVFHIYLGYLQDDIYEIEALNTMIIARLSDRVLNIVGVFSTTAVTFAELVDHLPFEGVEEITFGFMPYWDDCKYEMKEYTHDPLYVKSLECDLGEFKFPDLAIT